MARIVKISDMTEEEKKKWQEQVNTRYQERISSQQSEKNRANKLFNELINNSSNSNFIKSNPQTVTLPTANNSSKYSYRNTQNILPTSSQTSTNNVKMMKEPVKDISGVLKGSNAFDDGYQFGDITKTVGSSVADLGANIVKGMTNITESTGDLISYGIAQLAENTGHKDYANRLRKVTARNQFDDNLFTPINNKIDGNSVLGQRTDSVAQGVGQVATTTALAMAGQTGAGALGLGTTGTKVLTSALPTLSTFTTGMGNGMTEAYNSGATDDEAWKYGFISGLAEAGTEAMFGGLGRMTGALGLGSGLISLDDTIAKKISSIFKSRLLKNLTEYTVKAGAEGLEEVASGFIQAIGQKLTYKSEEELRHLLKDQKLLEQFIDGTIVSAIAQAPGPSGIIQTTKQNRDFITGLTPGQEIINNDEVQQKLQEAQDIINNLQNQQEQLNNTINTQTQQIVQEENKVAENGLSEQIKIDSENFAKQVESVKNGTFPKNDMLVLGQTPQVLKDIGLSDLPITMTQKHLDTIMNESGTDKNANYHGLGEDVVKQLPEAINNPLDIVKSNTRDDSIVLTTYLADKQDRPVVASIKIDGKGRINNIRIDTNVMTSAYGRSNYDKFMQDNIRNGKLLYDIDRGVIKKVTGARLQLPRSSNFLDSNESNIGSNNTNSNATTNSITSSNENVKHTNYSMQNGQNNTQKAETNLEKYTKYKKNILDRRAEQVNSLISYKNETIRNIDKKIAEKQDLWNSKKKKDTKVANTIKIQIENLKMQKEKVFNLYNEKIDKVNAKTNKEKINFETRNSLKKLARESLKAEIFPLTSDLTKYKDKKAGILYNRETAQRNIDDIVLDKELAEAIKETIFNPVQVHQAQKNREIKQLFDKINSLNLDKKKKYDYTVEDNQISGEVTDKKKYIKIDEATLAQLLIEKKITDIDLKNTYNMGNEQINKIHKTANTFTEILDFLYNRMNEEQIKFGYSPIGKLDNYFPHFFENKPDTMLGKIASYFGIDLTNQDLPTEIAGKTDTFKPGKTWNSNTLQRKTNKTDYDALKAMQKYIQGATDIIYITEDIQKIREYERQIRYQYSDKGIQESIDNILNDNKLTQEAKDVAIDGIFKNTENELSNFVTWLNDYANALANKKSFADRNMERNIGRNLYSSMSGIEARIASNTIGGNLSVSLTNFAPLFQAIGTTKVNYLLTGMLQTTSNNIKAFTGNKDISFADNSNFLTRRFGVDTIANKKVTQKISDFASIPMNAIDEFTAESIVRAKYLENIDRGMTEEQALDNADKYTAKIMADRSKGALPLVFNAKNPISKLVTMFQVEPNNIVSNYLKDIPREANNKVELTKQATKLMISSYAFNTLVMAIRGGNEVLPDPIRWVSYLIKAITGDEEEKEQARTDLMESIIGSVPFVSNVAGLFGFEDVGRIPISNAMPNINNIFKVFDGELDADYRKETALKEILKPLIYLGLPTGGAQIKKTIEGIATVSAGGSYKTDKNGNKILQFPVEDANVGDYIKAGVFGKYSLPMAKEYQDRNFKSLTAKQTKTYEEAQLPYKEYLDYIDAGLKTKEKKINYLSEQKWTENQKWNIYINDILSSTEREDGSSQVSDAKYITSHGVSKLKFMTLYNRAYKYNISMPTEEKYKELRKEGISLEKYINDKISEKNKKE